MPKFDIETQVVHRHCPDRDNWDHEQLGNCTGCLPFFSAIREYKKAKAARR